MAKRNKGDKLQVEHPYRICGGSFRKRKGAQAGSPQPGFISMLWPVSLGAAAGLGLRFFQLFVLLLTMLDLWAQALRHSPIPRVLAQGWKCPWCLPCKHQAPYPASCENSKPIVPSVGARLGPVAGSEHRFVLQQK